MFGKWRYVWDNYLSKIQADKFWHFILFLFFTIALFLFPSLLLKSILLICVLALIFFIKANWTVRGTICIGILALIFSFIFLTKEIQMLVVISELAIGKELWDWWHGKNFDHGDLMADAIGVFFGYMINGMYVSFLT